MRVSRREGIQQAWRSELRPRKSLHRPRLNDRAESMRQCRHATPAEQAVHVPDADGSAEPAGHVPLPGKTKTQHTGARSMHTTSWLARWTVRQQNFSNHMTRCVGAARTSRDPDVQTHARRRKQSGQALLASYPWLARQRGRTQPTSLSANGKSMPTSVDGGVPR